MRSYPSLQTDKAYAHFFGHLAFGTHREDETGYILIPAIVLAKMEGKEKLQAQHNYNGERFLERFSRDVLYFEWKDWRYIEKRVRVVTFVNFPPEVLALIENERLGHWKDEKRVYFHDGSSVTRYKKDAYFSQDKSESLEQLQDAGCDLAQDLLGYLNTLPTNNFSKLRVRIEEARRIARTLSKGRDKQLNLLQKLEDGLQPLYKPTFRSVRIFPYDTSINQLQRDIRKIITKDWIEFDLSSAQLAICAKVWEVGEVQDFLRSGRSIWTHLFEHFQIKPSAEYKSALKRALYATLFGGIKRTIEKELEPLGIPNAGRIYFRSPLIKAVWKARNIQLKKINDASGAMNCFGKFIAIDPIEQVKKRSVLAQIAQAWEMKLLEPVIRLAIEQRNKADGFVIMLWQHDGFSIHLRRKSKRNSWLGEIKMAVDLQAKHLGFITSLEENKEL